MDRVTKVERMKTSENEKPKVEKKKVELCDVCKAEGSEKAISFCIDCGKKMCPRHDEVRSGIRDSRHLSLSSQHAQSLSGWLMLS